MEGGNGVSVANGITHSPTQPKTPPGWTPPSESLLIPDTLIYIE